MLELDGVTAFFIADKLIEPASNSILSQGVATRIEPKAMQVLLLLSARAGQVVTREELEDTVWADVIVGPDAVTNTIIKLRRALGDKARNPLFIETIPKTGYRLIAQARVAEAGEIERPLQRRLSAILYADVAEYSRLTGEDEERTHRVLSANLDFFAELITSHNGTVVHYAGDAILAEFTTVTDALGCAVEVQTELHDRDAASPDTPSVRFRIGINIGEVIVDRDDIYGDGVNIAARLESLADAGGICISESVYAAIGRKLPLHYEFMGEQTVKNIAEPVRAYRVLLQSSAQKAKPAGKRFKRVGNIAVVVAAIAFGTIAAINYFATGDRPEAVIEVAAISEKPMIVVLPFANVSVDVDEKYLAEGITRDIINAMARVSAVDVIAFSSVREFDNKAIDIEQIRRELGADYLVEGSIRRAGGRVRINAQLLDIAKRSHLWSDQLEGKYDDFFALQDEVVSKVVTAVKVTLTDTESARIERLPTRNLQAYDLYLRAEEAGYIVATSDISDTLELYRQAIALDPEFADAHSGLARVAVEIWRSDSGIISGAQARAFAYEHASRALEIDPANGQAYSVLAILQLADGRHDAAIVSAKKAVEIAPGSARAYLDLGLVQAYSGEPKQGIAALERALRLNPKPTPDTELYTGIVFFIDGQYQRAEIALSKGVSGRKNTETGLNFLAAASALNGNAQGAQKAIAESFELFPSSSIKYYQARDTYFRRPEDLERLLNGLEKAGLPVWAFDFQGVEADRLDEQELLDVITGKTWTGRHFLGAEFVQSFENSGVMAYASQNSIQTGVASIQQGLLCQRFDGTTMNKELCGYVYRNPGGSSATQDDYVVSMPESLRYFTVSP